jgi:DNA invertase Pin-like site-specific DNA recombinase
MNFCCQRDHEANIEMTKAYSYIRMSTDAQVLGDSLRRQTEQTEKFCREQGYDLDTTFELRDIGFSAYDGSNVSKGDLGKFVSAVQAGRIERGSVLVVESLDRLSRQTPRTALRLFLDLLDHGINVATLIDRRTYAPDSTDQFDLMMSIMLMTRAHDESLHKSHRLRAVWENKRKHAQATILTSRCKAWLKPKSDRTGFVAIPDRATTVRRIFFEAADGGFGVDSIARRLNRERIPTFGRSRGWHKSYVLNILTDRAVLGEFQPHLKGKTHRIAAGNPMSGYYPILIEHELFYRAQSALQRRRISGGGRKGARISNLFSKIAKCGLCGCRMTFVNKGGKGGRSLVCGSARRGLGCSPIGWRYEEFERSFLTFIREVDLGSLSGKTGRSAELATLERQAAALDGQLAELKHQRERVFSLIMGDESTDFLTEKLRSLDAEVRTKGDELTVIKASVEEISRSQGALSDGFAQIGGLIDRLQAESGDDICNARSAVAARLIDIVDQLIVWPGGKPTDPHAEALIRGMISEEGRDPNAEIEIYVSRLDKAHRAFFVRFKDGSHTFVAPFVDNPVRFRSFSDSRGLMITDDQLHLHAAWKLGIDLDGATPDELLSALASARSEVGLSKT